MHPSFPPLAAPSRLLTQDELSAYHRDGVVCARGLLELPLIDRLADALEHAIAEENVLVTCLAIFGPLDS